MKPVVVILLTLLLGSCINEGDLRPVIPIQLINSNSAKTWIKTGHLIKNKNTAPRLNELRTTYTFYHDGTFREQQMIHLGSNKGRVGRFNLSITKQQDTLLRLYYHLAEDVEFKIKHIDSRSLKIQRDSVLWILETMEPPLVE